MMIGRDDVESSAGSHIQIQREIKRVLLWLRPDGGQSRARRNAWAAMVADSKRRQERVLAGREGQVSVKTVLQAQVP